MNYENSKKNFIYMHDFNYSYFKFSLIKERKNSEDKCLLKIQKNQKKYTIIVAFSNLEDYRHVR